MANDLTLSARLQLDARQWTQSLSGAQSKTRNFVNGLRSEFSRLGEMARSTGGALASIGVGYSAAVAVAQSARLDRDLEQVRQIAKATTREVDALRQGVFQLGKTYGVSTQQAHEGFRSLVAGGLSWDQANTALGAMSQAVAVTKANYGDLANAMKSASANFGVNLGDLGEATKLINEMAAAADAGSAEIEHLSSIFGALGSAPRDAGMSRQRTMAYVEAMAGSVDIGNLGTRVKSTVALFNNQQYMRDVTKATGVPFYRDGVRRDDITVLKEIRDVLSRQPTQQARDQLLFRALGKADQDTQLGVRYFTNSPGKIERLSALDDVINKASVNGIADRVPAAINNAVDSAQRLKATLTEAADGFARPLNDAITRLTRPALDKKQDGGLDMSGGQLVASGAAVAGGAYVASRFLPPMLSKLLGGGASLAGGVAMGTALEKAGAATPVFIVGAAPGLFGSGSGVAAAGGAARGAGGGMAAGARGWLARIGLSPAGLATASRVLGGVGIAATAGWGVGTGINKATDSLDSTRSAKEAYFSYYFRMYDKVLAALGGVSAKEREATREKIEIQLTLDDMRSRVAGIRVNGRDATATVGIGRRGPNFGRMLSSPGID